MAILSLYRLLGYSYTACVQSSLVCRKKMFYYILETTTLIKQCQQQRTVYQKTNRNNASETIPIRGTVQKMNRVQKITTVQY